MCLAKAYKGRSEQSELVMEEVSSLKMEGHKVILKTLFGEQKEVAGVIREIDFQKGRIVLEQLA